MKFTDGFWNMRTGVTPHYAVHVHDIELTSEGITAYAPTQRITHRGDTLNIPMLTVEFTSPMRNVIRVRISHHQGGVEPKALFQLFPQEKPQLFIKEDDAAAVLTSGDLSVRIDKGANWQVDFLADSKILTNSGFHNMAYLDVEGRTYMREQLALGVGEYVYGMGERFTPFMRNGQTVDLWNADGGTSSEQAYKNIPFYLTNRGYGVFINHPDPVSFEVASENVERVQFSLEGEMLDYFIIYGPTPKEVLERYTALTGRPALPPAWSFGLWLTTSFTTSYDEETVTGFIEGMAERDLPLHVFHYDCFWMKEFHWCDFEWDTRVFPDPEGMLARLKERGLHICVWINPYIAQRSALFKEGKQEGYLLKRPDGSVWQWDKWQSGMGIVDFTNPEACEWYAKQLRRLIDMGVDTFKTDFGERIPTDVVYANGADPVRMHNYYTHLYNQTVFQVLEKKLGKGEAVVFSRSATVGGQQYPVHWGGDSTASFESMAESLRGGLSLGLCGFGFWSHDIGGFEHTASADVYKRWCAFGLLSSHSRLHGSSTYRVPWLFDEEAVDVLRHFTNLKCQLMPYLFQSARQAQRSGTPMLRAMMLEYPEDPACATLDTQYMLGDSLLVAPIFTHEGSVQYYLPEGRWTNYFTGKVVEGNRWQKETHDFFSLPLMVRQNTVLPTGNRNDQPDYDYADGVCLRVYSLDEEAEHSIELPALDGSTAAVFQVKRHGQLITAEVVEGSAENWSLLLVGMHQAANVQGGTAKDTSDGLLAESVDGEMLRVNL